MSALLLDLVLGLAIAENENQNILSAVRVHQVSPHQSLQRDINVVEQFIHWDSVLTKQVSTCPEKGGTTVNATFSALIQPSIHSSIVYFRDGKIWLNVYLILLFACSVLMD